MSLVNIIPFSEGFGYFDSCLCDYLGNPIVIFKDYEQIKFSYDRMVVSDYEFNIDTGVNYFDIRNFRSFDSLYYFDFDMPINIDYLSSFVSFDVSTVPVFGENFSLINKYISDSISECKTVVLCTSTGRINEFLEGISLPYVITDFDAIYDGKVNVVRSDLSSGFEVSKYVFLSDHELFGKKSVKYKKTRFRNTSRIRDLSRISVGDYVVHNTHGICWIYNICCTFHSFDFWTWKLVNFRI